MEKYELTEDEMKVVLAMRKFGPFATFKIEKRPTRIVPEGELIKVVTEIRQTMRSIQSS